MGHERIGFVYRPSVRDLLLLVGGKNINKLETEAFFWRGCLDCAAHPPPPPHTHHHHPRNLMQRLKMMICSFDLIQLCQRTWRCWEEKRTHLNTHEALKGTEPLRPYTPEPWVASFNFRPWWCMLPIMYSLIMFSAGLKSSRFFWTHWQCVRIKVTQKCSGLVYRAYTWCSTWFQAGLQKDLKRKKNKCFARLLAGRTAHGSQ